MAENNLFTGSSCHSKENGDCRQKEGGGGI